MKIVHFILILFLGFGFLLGQEKIKCNKNVDYIEGTLFIYLESNSFDFPLESYATYISYEESNIKMDSIIINQFRHGTKIVDSKKVVKYNSGDAKSIGLSKEPKLKLNKNLISLFKKYGVYYIGRRIESFSPQDTLPHYIESRRKGRILTKRPNYNKHLIIKFTDKSNTKKFAEELQQLEGIKKVEFDQEVFEFFVPNDPNYINDQGGVDQQDYMGPNVMDFEGAWGIVKGDTDPDNIITIVIIDKDFEISVFNCEGKYVLSNSSWISGEDAITLPDNYCWLRDENNYVIGRFKVIGLDNTGYEHQATKTFKIVGVSTFSTIDQDMTWCGNFALTNDITVNSGVTLTVNPDTKVQFSPNKSFTINVTLNVNGTFGRPVTFTRSGTSGNWNYIKFNSSGSGTISNAKIQYAKKGIYNLSDAVNIEDCFIEHFTEQGIYSYYGDINVEDCIIRNPNGASYGIYLKFCNSTISGTEVYDISGIGVYDYFSNMGTFSDGRIEDCSTGFKTYYSSMQIYNNYFEDNTYGIRLGTNSDNVDIHDNDFVIM